MHLPASLLGRHSVQLSTAAPSGGFCHFFLKSLLFLSFLLSLCLCTVCVYCHKGTFSDPSSCADGHSEGPHGRTGLFPSSEFLMGRRGCDEMARAELFSPRAFCGLILTGHSHPSPSRFPNKQSVTGNPPKFSINRSRPFPGVRRCH